MIGIVGGITLVLVLLAGIGWLFEAVIGPANTFAVQRIDRPSKTGADNAAPKETRR